MRVDFSRAALRTIGAAGLVGVVTTFIGLWNFRRLEQETGTSTERLAEYARVQQFISFGDVAVLLTIAIGAVLLATSRPREGGRTFAIGAAVLAGLRLIVIGAIIVRPPESSEAYQKIKWVFVAFTLIAVVIVVLAMLAITSSPTRVPLAVVTGALATILALVPRMLTDPSATLHYSVVAASDLALAVGPLILAQSINEVATPSRERASGAPLRLLAGAVAWRVVIGVVAVVLTTISVASKSAELASMWTGLAALLSFGCTVVMVIALVGHLRSGAPGMMPGAIVFAMIAALVAVVVDVFATSAAIELFNLIEKAQKATSFWGMPSLSKIEELQETARFASRVQIGLGTAATFALAISLRATAHACKADGAASTAVRVMILALVAAGASFGISTLMEKPKLREELLFVGLGAICLAIWLIASWLGLLRDVAHALDANEAPERAAS